MKTSEINAISTDIPKSLVDVNTEMVLHNDTAYFGEMMLQTAFYEAKGLGTCGVNLGTRGPKFYYDNGFIDKLNVPQTKMLIVHEMSHILFNHPKRTKKGNFNKRKANVIQDMIINSLIKRDFSDFEFVKGMSFVPEEYDGDWIFEKLYNWVDDKVDEMKQEDSGQQSDREQSDSQNGQQGQSDSSDQSEGNQQSQGSGSGQEQSDENSDGSGSGDSDENSDGSGQDKTDMNDVKRVWDNIEKGEGQGSSGETFDKHIEDEVPEEVREQFIKEFKQRMKNRGLETGKMKSFLDGLTKPKKDYLKSIKRGLAAMKGKQKGKTYSRPNRYGFKHCKGTKKTSVKLTAIIDVSGSCYSYLPKMISTLFQNNIVVDLIQADTQVNKIVEIENKKQLKKMEIIGCGGTVLQPAVNHVKKHIPNQNLVVISDGYVDTLNFDGIKGKVLILTTDQLVPTTGNKNVKQIVIEDY